MPGVGFEDFKTKVGIRLEIVGRTMSLTSFELWTELGRLN